MYNNYKYGVPDRVCHVKYLIIMKLSFLLLIIPLLPASASSFAQGITLSKQNATLPEIFTELRKQTDYTFIYSSTQISNAKKVSISVKDAAITDVLDRCFEDQALTYTITNNIITVKEKPQSLFNRIIKRFSAVIVTGTVFDDQGNVLAGATVKLQGSKSTTRTDEKGFFSINSDQESGTITISYLGYLSEQVNFSTDNIGPFKVLLKQETSGLEQVEINAGYYTVKDRERTGSISKVTAEQIEKQPVNNVLQAMQANVPGLQIVQNSGVPGGGFTVRIRGQNSIANGNNPFYIIDGVPFTATGLSGTAGTGAINMTANANPLSSINPFDIQSIEVLKDADATAIYGSRGANGVILITTKRGIPGNTKSSFSISQGIARVGKMLDLMNTQEYLTMRQEALSNDNLPISDIDYDLNGTWDKTKYTNWQKELIGGIASTTNIQTSVSGGVANVTYLIGGNHYRESTVFPGSNSFNRNSANFSLRRISENKKLQVAFDSNYSQVNSSLFIIDLTQFITLAPNYPNLLNENGTLNWANNTMYVNPIATTKQPYEAKTNNLVSNATISYDPLTSLSLKGTIGFTKMDRKEISNFPLSTYSPAFNYGTERRISNFTNNANETWIAEFQATWNKNIGRSKLNFILGSTFQQNLTDIQEVKGTGYQSDALLGNIAAASTLTIPNRSYLQYRYGAIFGRANYILNGKYILNITARRDGSTRFGNDNRFANFGAIGGAWIISDEGFIRQNLSFISFAKLRSSYGIAGNDQIRDYGYQELWGSSGSYQGISTMIPRQLANPNYGWEINKKAEVALEAGLWDGRFTFSAGYYSNRASNQLVQKPITPSTGFSFINDNLHAIVGNTGWEFELGAKTISNRAFSWSTLVNLSVPRNKLIDYPGLQTSNYANVYQIGQPLSIKRLFATSVDPVTGLYSVEDHDGNGVIDFDIDLYKTKFIGRTFFGGVQNSINYKGLELDFTFQFVKQTGNGYLSTFNQAGALYVEAPSTNQPIELLARWKNSGDISTYQKFSTLGDANTSFFYAGTYGDFAVEDSSFIRLKNASLSYFIGRQLLEKLKLANAKLFLQAQNVLTITRYKGLDPETLSGFALPTLQSFSAGVQLTF